MRTRSIAVAAVLAMVLGGVLFVAPPRSLESLPWELVSAGPRVQRDTTFGAHILRLSEPGGYFDTDNLISNERSYLHVAPALRARAGGGAYIGVGPDQNFAYIALLRPRVAYILDIRRDNLLVHLLFKALFERSPDRAAYLAGLTGRSLASHDRDAVSDSIHSAGPPAQTAFGVPGAAVASVDQNDQGDGTLEQIVRWIDSTPVDPEELARVQRDVRARIERYGYPLADEDHATIARVHQAFAAQGLSLRFKSHGRAPLAHYPTLRDLLTETDRNGVPAGAFVDEASYRYLRQMQQQDRIIPVIGDFSGTHALRAIAEELQEEETEVRVFYTSNVEYYLFRSGTFGAFADNVSRLPWHDDALLIRSVFRGGPPSLASHAVPGYGSVQLAQPARSFIDRVRSGGYATYRDLTGHDILPPR